MISDSKLTSGLRSLCKGPFSMENTCKKALWTKAGTSLPCTSPRIVIHGSLTNGVTDSAKGILRLVVSQWTMCTISKVSHSISLLILYVDFHDLQHQAIHDCYPPHYSFVRCLVRKSAVACAAVTWFANRDSPWVSSGKTWRLDRHTKGNEWQNFFKGTLRNTNQLRNISFSKVRQSDYFRLSTLGGKTDLRTLGIVLLTEQSYVCLGLLR